MHLARRPGLTEGAPRRAAFGRANSFAPPPSPRYVPDPDSCACTLAQDRLEKKNCTELAQIASQVHASDRDSQERFSSKHWAKSCNLDQPCETPVLRGHANCSPGRCSPRR
jgi:hypothetical protein